jgi:hypothetical protein
VAFARLLVRDVSVVVLDEATARMDPVTESRVVAASQRLLAGRTGVLIAHRLTTTARADDVAVLDAGRVVQHGPRAVLAAADGPFRRLLEASDDTPGTEQSDAHIGTAVGSVRRTGEPPPAREVASGPGLARGIWHALRIHPQWGLVSVGLFLASTVLGAYGAITGWLWGHLVVDLQEGGRPVALLAGLVVSLLSSPLLLAEAIGRYPRWWVSVRRPLGRLRQRPGHRRNHGRRRGQRARRRGAARGHGGLGRGVRAGLAGRRAVGGSGVRGTGRFRPLPGVGARVDPHREARRGHPGGSRAPAAGRRRPGRRGG